MIYAVLTSCKRLKAPISTTESNCCYSWQNNCSIIIFPTVSDLCKQNPLPSWHILLSNGKLLLRSNFGAWKISYLAPYLCFQQFNYLQGATLCCLVFPSFRLQFLASNCKHHHFRHRIVQKRASHKLLQAIGE